MSIKTILASAAALAMAAGTPAFAAKGSQGDQAAASDAKAKGERKICRTYDASESRMKRTKLCMTREEWRKFDDER